MPHRNAPLTPQGRYRFVMRVQAGRPIAHVAAEAGIARATLSKWVARYRQGGISELEGRSSAPPAPAPRWWTSSSTGALPASDLLAASATSWLYAGW